MQIDIIDVALTLLLGSFTWVWFKSYFEMRAQTAPTQKVALDAPQPKNPAYRYGGNHRQTKHIRGAPKATKQTI